MQGIRHGVLSLFWQYDSVLYGIFLFTETPITSVGDALRRQWKAAVKLKEKSVNL